MKLNMKIFFSHFLTFSIEGFHAGTAIGCVIGDRNLQYCVFGDAVTVVCS